MIKIKIKRFGLIEVTEERLARADGRSSFFLTHLKSLARARADGRSSLRRATKFWLYRRFCRSFCRFCRHSDVGHAGRSIVQSSNVRR